MLVVPEISDLQVSRDGKYYSFFRTGDGPARLYIGRRGHPPNALGDVGRVVWIGDHSLLFEQHDWWYRADPTDDAYSGLTIKQIVRKVANDRQHAQGIRDVSRDGRRVIFNLGDTNAKRINKLSPWRYDVATGRLTRIVDNVRYREIILDEQARPAFAIDLDERSGGGAFKLFERSPVGWVERTLDLPALTIEVIDYRGGTLALRTGTPTTPRYTLWDPKTNAARPWFPKNAADAVVAEDGRTVLMWREGMVWHALDEKYAALAATFSKLGIDQVSNASSNVWVASAPVGLQRSFYTVGLASGEIREIGPHRDRAMGTGATEGEVVTIHSPSREPADDVTVFRASGATHGVVFLGTSAYSWDRDLEQAAQLLASRGYHVVTGTDSHPLESATAAHAAWAIGRFGALPIACVNLQRCDFQYESPSGGASRGPGDGTARLAAIVRASGLNEPGGDDSERSSEPGVAELVLGAGRTRSTSFNEYDKEQAYFARPEYAAKRARAQVAGVTFRGAFSSSGERRLVEFAVIEGFLAQHLGGRMEPMPWNRFRTGGLKVVYGFDKLTFLEKHPEFELRPLTTVQRDELLRDFAKFTKAIYALPIEPPCDTIPERISRLRLPPILAAHRDSDEVQVLLNNLTVELGDVALAAGCTTGMITSAAEEAIRRAPIAP